MHSIIYRSMKDLCSKFLSNRLAVRDQPVLPFGHAAWRYTSVDTARICTVIILLQCTFFRRCVQWYLNEQSLRSSWWIVSRWWWQQCRKREHLRSTSWIRSTSNIYFHVPRVHSVARILYLQFVLQVMLLRSWNMLCTFTLALPVVRVQCPRRLFFAVPLISCFLGTLLRCCPSDFEIVPVALFISGITFPFTLHMRW